MEILKYIFDFDISRMFDCDNDGFLTVHDLRRIMTSLGDDKLSKKDVEMMVEEADKDQDGLVNCQGQESKKCMKIIKIIPEFCSLLCPDSKKSLKNKDNTKKGAQRKVQRIVKIMKIKTLSVYK